MPDIVIHNATVLTLDDQDCFYYPGTVEIENGRISAVYKGDARPGVLESAGLVIDGTEKLVMPGLVDLHFHTSVAKVC